MPTAITLKPKYKLHILLKVFLFFSFKNGQNFFVYLPYYFQYLVASMSFQLKSDNILRDAVFAQLSKPE